MRRALVTQQPALQVLENMFNDKHRGAGYGPVGFRIKVSGRPAACICGHRPRLASSALPAVKCRLDSSNLANGNYSNLATI